MDVPEDFGAEGGKPIENKTTILKDIDDALGRSKPPAVEYLWCKPFVNRYFLGFFWVGNYYGQYVGFG